MLSSFRIILSVITIPLYATAVFPFIPQALGGGKLQMISLYIKPEMATVIQHSELLQSDLRIDSASAIDDVFLVSAEGDSYVITSRERGAQLALHTYKIPKTYILIVVQRSYWF